MLTKRLLSATVLLAGVAALAVPAAADDIPIQFSAGKQISAFGEALHRDYYELAGDRTQIDINDEDWTYFLGKGFSAHEGYLVIPEPMNARDLDMTIEDPLENARIALMQMLEDGGRDLIPNQASKAQVAFDCWMEEAERDRQKRHSVCQQRFETAMANAQSALASARAPQPTQQAAMPAPKAAVPAAAAPAPAPVPKMVAGPRVIKENWVFFDWDSARLSSTANQLVAEMARFLISNRSSGITVVGHTDTSGTNAYNFDLSRHRANTVRDELVRHGVQADRIRVDAVGETDSAENLGDGVRSARNRRVLVAFDVEGPMVMSSK